MAERELTIIRTLDAPLARVWKAWTTQEEVRQWWGPRGVTNPTCEWDARPGGKINIVMLAGKELGPAAGQRWPMAGIFKEIVPLKKIVFASTAVDDVKAVLLENTVTVMLEEAQGKTRMNVQVVVTKADDPRSKFMLEGMDAGFKQQFDKLAEFLIKK